MDPVRTCDVSNRAEMLMNDRDGGRDDGTEDPSLMFGCNGAGADGLSSVIGGPGSG
jgi:hypothetical protein